jgi:UDP-glucose 4-epimerase
MKAIVTGGSGFVGANLTRRLLTDGHDVHLLARSPVSWRLQEVTSETQIHQVDVRDKDGVMNVVKNVKPDAVFHLAAFGAYPNQTGIEAMLSTNLLGCVSVLDACLAAGVGVFIHAGSSSEYGYKDHPSAEEERIEPNSLYAITKAAATHYCQLVARQSNVHAVTLRLYSIYGPYEEPTRLIPTLLIHGMEGQLPGLVSPHTARDFVYVDDAVDAMLRVASMTNLPRGSVYNVCSGIQSRLMDVVALARELLNIDYEPQWSSMEQREWDTNVWVGSSAAIEQAAGWRFKVDLKDGLSRTIAWLRAHPDWLTFYRERILAQ